MFFFLNASAGIHQKRLLRKLFSNYDPNERPVLNDEQVLTVMVGLSIQQIVDLVSSYGEIGTINQISLNICNLFQG